MSNYTKTTNFATKDSLPSGDPNKIVKGAEINTEFDNIATAVATKANSASPTFTGTVTIPTADINGGAIDGTVIGGTTAASVTGTTLTANTSLNIAGDGATVTGIKDEDDMASNSATKLATQQSIKAYVDSQVTAQDLDVTTDSGTISIDLDSETLTVAGGTGLDSSATGNTVTLEIDSTVATLTGTQTLTNKTLTAPVISGNLTTDGTIDGRDVATDGTKLDNIEANADVTDTANVTAAGALMDSEVTNLAQVKAFDSADYATAAQGTTADSAMQDLVDDTTPQLGGDLSTNGNDISFGDNDKAIFGAGSDLQIYHDSASNHSIIAESGSGSLFIRGQSITMQNADGSKAYFGGNGDVATAYYGTSAKLATTSTGIDVTGKVSSDGLEVDLSSSGNVELTGAANSNAGLVVRDPTATSYGAHFSYDDANTRVSIGGQTNGTKNTAISIGRDSNDISFYEDTGTTAKFFWDASAERLGIGTTSPSNDLHISSATGSARLSSTGGGANLFMESADGNTTRIRWDSNANFAIRNDATSSDVFNINQSGNVGIGTSSPSGKLEVNGGTGVATSGGTFIVRQDGDTYADGIALTSSNATSHRLWKDSSGRLNIGPSNLPSAMVQDLSGNVGIGTSSPSYVVSSRNDSAVSYPLSLESGTLGTVGNTVGMLFGYAGNTYQKGAVIFESVDSNARGKMHFALDNSVGSGNVQLSDAKMTIDYSGNVGIGTSSPAQKLDVNGNIRVQGTYPKIEFVDTNSNPDFTLIGGNGAFQFYDETNSSERMRIDSSGNVGIGTNNPSGNLVVVNTGGGGLNIGYNGTSVNYIDADTQIFRSGSYTERMRIDSSGNVGIGTTTLSYKFQISDGIRTAIINPNSSLDGIFFGTKESKPLIMGTSDNERLRIDSSGNVLVGTTSVNPGLGNTNEGHSLNASGTAVHSADGNNALRVNRNTTDGTVVTIAKDGTTVGSIGTVGGLLGVGSGVSNLQFESNSTAISPASTTSGGASDGSLDLGKTNRRFNDIYATNGTIQTSDRNEKQDIAELSEAEQRVAVAAKGLLRKFRWKDSVAEKGDDARIHFGIIAQDLQAAFEAEGLDAGDYAMFISTTWTDEETNEEKTRMGVRYSELLAFIISAI